MLSRPTKGLRPDTEEVNLWELFALNLHYFFHLGMLAMSHFPSFSLSPGSIPFPCSALGTHKKTVVGRTRPRFCKNIVQSVLYTHTQYIQYTNINKVEIFTDTHTHT